MGLDDKLWLMDKLTEMGWVIVDEEHFFVKAPDDFWDAQKGRDFHVYHAQAIFDLLVQQPEQEIEE